MFCFLRWIIAQTKQKTVNQVPSSIFNIVRFLFDTFMDLFQMQDTTFSSDNYLLDANPSVTFVTPTTTATIWAFTWLHFEVKHKYALLSDEYIKRIDRKYLLNVRCGHNSEADYSKKSQNEYATNKQFTHRFIHFNPRGISFRLGIEIK